MFGSSLNVPDKPKDQGVKDIFHFSYKFIFFIFLLHSNRNDLFRHINKKNRAKQH